MRDTATTWTRMKIVRLDVLQHVQFVVLLFQPVGDDNLEGHITLSARVKNQKEPRPSRNEDSHVVFRQPDGREGAKAKLI